MLKATCTSQSPKDIIGEFVDILPPAYGMDVMNFIRDSGCWPDTELD
ncbi:MAG TPA: hypothetical protein VJP79_04735 [Nitrososphaera sp.]|nr:hypothetical protein [Nitrososphaera sp.]